VKRVQRSDEEQAEIEQKAIAAWNRVTKGLVEFWSVYVTLLFFGGALLAISKATASWWATTAYWINMSILILFLINTFAVNGPIWIPKGPVTTRTQMSLVVVFNTILIFPLLWFHATAARELAVLISRTTVVN
jgi:hypothetical protein